MAFSHFDFRCIDGYLQHYPLGYMDNVSIYDDDVSHTYHHICQFLHHISNYGEVSEDVSMKWFSRTLDGNAKMWLHGLPRRNISSFVGLVKKFMIYWGPNYKNGGDFFAPLGEEMCEGNHMPCEEETLHEEAQDEDHVHETLENDSVQDVQEEVLDKVLEDEEDDDVVNSSLLPSPNVHNDVGTYEDNDILSYMFDDVGVAHDD